LLATAAIVRAMLEESPRKSWRNFSHDSDYSYTTCQKAAKKKERRSWWMIEAHLVGTKQANTGSLLPTMSSLEFAGNTSHHIIYGRNLVPSLSLTACGTAGRRGHFRQYSATCHVTRESMVMIQSFAYDRVIYTLQPPPSPDLTPLDLWLWRYFQEGVLRNKTTDSWRIERRNYKRNDVDCAWY
jgi:hypothetical protein